MWRYLPSEPFFIYMLSPIPSDDRTNEWPSEQMDEWNEKKEKKSIAMEK